jgi:predicted nucleic-acid-binding Zn-ribbon protein
MSMRFRLPGKIRRMGLFSKKPSLATVCGRAMRCLVCANREFWSRETKLNSTGAEFLGLAWANQSALALICASCGYVHEFAGEKPKLWDAARGYPSGAE